MEGSVMHAGQKNGRPAETLCAQSFKTQYIPLLFSCSVLPIVFSTTSPRGHNNFKTAIAVQTASCQHSHRAPPTRHHHQHHHQRLPFGLTLVTPPLEKSTKRPLCESTETWVMLLYIIVFSHCHTTTVHSGTVSSSGGASLSPLTFSQPFSPWHDAQTTHCTARPTTPSNWMWKFWYGMLKKIDKIDGNYT